MMPKKYLHSVSMAGVWVSVQIAWWGKGSENARLIGMETTTTQTINPGDASNRAEAIFGPSWKGKSEGWNRT